MIPFVKFLCGEKDIFKMHFKLTFREKLLSVFGLALCILRGYCLFLLPLAFVLIPF